MLFTTRKTEIFLKCEVFSQSSMHGWCWSLFLWPSEGH